MVWLSSSPSIGVHRKRERERSKGIRFHSNRPQIPPLPFTPHNWPEPEPKAGGGGGFGSRCACISLLFHRDAKSSPQGSCHLTASDALHSSQQLLHRPHTHRHTEASVLAQDLQGRVRLRRKGQGPPVSNSQRSPHSGGYNGRREKQRPGLYAECLILTTKTSNRA